MSHLGWGGGHREAEEGCDGEADASFDGEVDQSPDELDEEDDGDGDGTFEGNDTFDEEEDVDGRGEPFDDTVDQGDADEPFPFPSPRILVVDARAKAHGVFFGRLIDAAVEENDLAAEVDQVLEASPYGGTKWVVDKQEGFGRLELGPHPALSDVATLATNIAAHGPIFIELVARLGGIPAIQYAARTMEEDFEGSYPARGGWARERTSADGLNPRGSWAKHVDWDALTREQEKQKEIFVIEHAGRFYVFRE